MMFMWAVVLSDTVRHHVLSAVDFLYYAPNTDRTLIESVINFAANKER